MPAALPGRAVTMARLAPEDRFAGLAPTERLAKENDGGRTLLLVLTGIVMAVLLLSIAAETVGQRPEQFTAPAQRAVKWLGQQRGGQGGFGATQATILALKALIAFAKANKRPIEARYQGRPRLFCPHRLGRNKEKQMRVLCYQYGGESQSGLEPPGSPANWRCIALEKLSTVRLLEDAWRTTAPNHSRPASCVVDADIDAEGAERHPASRPEGQAERDPQKGQ